MRRPRKLRTMIARMSDAKLKAYWDIRASVRNSWDRRLVRSYIVRRVRELRARRDR
jgi:hypothetical protein